VIAERPVVAALQAAFAATEAGRNFRIGGGAARVPQDTPTPMFETLTGGSTGTPRRIWRTQASWVRSFGVNADLFGIGPGIMVAVLGHLSHSLALYAAVEGVHLGAGVHLLAGMQPGRQARAIAARRIGILYATPVQLRLLLDAARGPVLQTAHVIVGGGALDAPLRGKLGLMFPNAVIHGFYGAAETSFVALSSASDTPGTAGMPYPGVRIALRDGEGAAAGDGPGEVWVQSPYLANGYAGADFGSARWKDGWVSVGEWGRMDAGQLIILGRASRMVRIADQSVFPEEIEAFLLGQPGVQDAAIVARPDMRRGHVLEAILRGDPSGARAILMAAKSRFGPLAAPRRVHWRQDWPQLPSGKTDLARLADDLA
jgi:long-chain acyl-CoA synthetase